MLPVEKLKINWRPRSVYVTIPWKIPRKKTRTPTPFTLGIEGWSLVLKRMICELQPTRSQPPRGKRGDSRVAKMILVVGGPLKIPLWGKWWLTLRTVLCLDFLARCLGSCHCLLFSVGSRFPWPSPARVTTLNQELTGTQLSLTILMRNLVLLDYCSWATSCQQFLKKLFNHSQLQRNRWHTRGGKKPLPSERAGNKQTRGHKGQRQLGA